jgi:hypothetical protein
MADRAVLLRELLELLHARANYLSIPELRGRTQQGKPADLTVRANVALACGADVRLHHGDPCIVKDPAAFDAAKQNGERMAAEAWDGLGHYFTSITDIERHLIPDGVTFDVHRLPVRLTDHGPVHDTAGDVLHGGIAGVHFSVSHVAVSPARALLIATLRYHAKEAGLDVA